MLTHIQICVNFFLREICWEVGVICVNLLCTFVVQIFLGRYVLRGVICANFLCEFCVYICCAKFFGEIYCAHFLGGEICWEVWFVQIPPLPCHNCQKCSLLRICKLAQVCSPLCICHQQHLLCSFPTQSWTIQIMPSEMEVVRFSNWLECNFKFLKFPPGIGCPHTDPEKLERNRDCDPCYWPGTLVIGIAILGIG